ncbi:GD25768 [Drosophila simulans]|uniref:GD25768 n=1 Tax=Drosophila simulans TaxID=7240 RepID=B4QE22_DROSI|nr:GD25768 [Drosophila simulans]
MENPSPGVWDPNAPVARRFSTPHPSSNPMLVSPSLKVKLSTLTWPDRQPRNTEKYSLALEDDDKMLQVKNFSISRGLRSNNYNSDRFRGQSRMCWKSGKTRGCFVRQANSEGKKWATGS